MLDTLLIQGRRLGYAVCAGEASAAATQDAIYGDLKCAKKNQRLAMFYWWAADVMNRTAIATDTCTDCMCVTDEFACSVIKLMDPGCIECGCGAESDRPINCAVTQDTTVYRGADAGLETILLPAIGVYFLITTNLNSVVGGWADHMGEIAVSDGATWTYTVPAPGTLIYDAFFQVYYIAYAGGVGPQYPVVSGTQVGIVLTLTSFFPAVNAVGGRDVIIQGSTDSGLTWTVPVYVGPESALAVPLAANVVGTVNQTRIYYYTEEYFCRVGPFQVAVPPPPITNSFRVLPVALPAAMSPIPGGIMDFNPADESQFVISFNVKATSIDQLFLPLTLQATKQNPGATCISVQLFFTATTYMAQQEYAFIIGVGPVIGPDFGGLIIFPGVYAAAFDGNWHNITIVRNSAIPGTFDAADVSMWVDNVQYAAVLDPAFLTGSFPVPTGLTYFPATEIATYQYIGDTFAFNTDFTFNNFYIAAYAPSPAEIASICYPAAYNGNDGAWSRRLWIRARQPDSLVALPWVDSNSPLSSAWKEYSAGDGGVTLVPDAPNWVAP